MEDDEHHVHVLDLFLMKDAITKETFGHNQLDDEIIWERKEPANIIVDWDRKMNCLNCMHEDKCPVQYKTELDRKKAKLLGMKMDECPYHFWKDFVPFIKHYNNRNEYLAHTIAPIPLKYFTKWSFRHEIDIYTDKMCNFLEIFKMFWYIIVSIYVHFKWKWDAYWVARTRKTVFMGFVVGMLVGFVLATILQIVMIGGFPWIG